MEINPNVFYSFREVGKNNWLFTGEAGVYNLIRAGKLKAINTSAGKKNKRYSIKGEWILEFLNGLPTRQV